MEYTQKSIQTTPKSYWDAPFDCDCTVEAKFINFWTASGQCCDNLRLSIWYIFNILFLILVIVFSIKICRERKERREELENFSRRYNEQENNDLSESSSAIF
jgi:hypothetical protein